MNLVKHICFIDVGFYWNSYDVWLNVGDNVVGKNGLTGELLKKSED